MLTVCEKVDDSNADEGPAAAAISSFGDGVVVERDERKEPGPREAGSTCMDLADDATRLADSFPPHPTLTHARVVELAPTSPPQPIPTPA
jgi:hypothetical protein